MNSRLLPDGSARLLVFVGPSGAGKDSVINAWLSSLPPAARPHRARRVITRPAGDHSEWHEVATPARFAELRQADALAFYWHAHGLDYGIRWSELAPLDPGWVVMNGSRAHLPQLRQLAPAARVIEITADESVRAQRIQARGREAGQQVQDRLARQACAGEVEWQLSNDGSLDEAVQALDAWWGVLARDI